MKNRIDTNSISYISYGNLRNNMQHTTQHKLTEWFHQQSRPNSWTDSQLKKNINREEASHKKKTCQNKKHIPPTLFILFPALCRYVKQQPGCTKRLLKFTNDIAISPGGRSNLPAVDCLPLLHRLWTIFQAATNGRAQGVLRFSTAPSVWASYVGSADFNGQNCISPDMTIDKPGRYFSTTWY